MKHILEDQQEQSQPQRDVPTREGMEPLNLSIVNNNSSNHVAMFDFDDDDSIDESQNVEGDNLKTEIMCYKKIKMKKEDKEKCNVLEWWKHHKTQFPSLFKAAQCLLHIPATSVPSERIFSLAGNIVCERRSKMLPQNANKFIFLKKNESVIPDNTPIWIS